MDLKTRYEKETGKYRPTLSKCVTLNDYNKEWAKWLSSYLEWVEIQFPRLVSVKDRLPNKPGHYLVYAPLSFPKNCRFVVAEFYDDNNTFYSESSDQPMEDVTYWSELPIFERGTEAEP